jgi:rubrerythrin
MTDGGTAQQTIDGSVKIGSTEIQAVTEDDKRDVLGWIVPFTIGNEFVVPRDWLEQRARELNLSPNILPKETTAKRGFTRAGHRVDDRSISEIEMKYDVDIHLNKVKYERRFEVEVHDRRTDDKFDGEMIGVIEFDGETEKMRGRPLVDPEHEMWDVWNDYVGAFKDEFALMTSSNLGEDIRRMIVEVFRHQSRSVKFRAGGGVYFAPQATEPLIKALDTLMTDIDREHKKSGYPCELDTIEVANTAEKKTMVEEKVRRNLEAQVRDIIEDAFDELADDEALVDEVADDVEAELDDVEDFASQYNALLDAKMTVRDHLEEWKERATGEAEELVTDLLGAPEEYECPDCGDTFEKKQSRNAHMASCDS